MLRIDSGSWGACIVGEGLILRANDLLFFKRRYRPANCQDEKRENPIWIYGEHSTGSSWPAEEWAVVYQLGVDRAGVRNKLFN